MQQFLKALWIAGLLGPSLTLIGLIQVQVRHRSVIEPGVPAYVSDWIEVRGLPSSWLITDRTGSAAELRWYRRVLVGPLLRSLIFNTILGSLIGATVLLLRRLRTKKGPSGGASQRG